MAGGSDRWTQEVSLVALAALFWMSGSGVAGLGLGLYPKEGARSSQAPVVAALDLYISGDSERALESAGPILVSGNLEAALRREGTAWIGAAGVAAAEKRQRALAAFVLELARAELERLQRHTKVGRYERPAMPSSSLRTTWQRVRPAIEWVCALWRELDERTEPERVWFLASLQLYRDFEDSDLRPTLGAGMTQGFEEFPGHLGHARSRFPREPWVELLSAERRTYSLASSVRVRRPLSEETFRGIEWLRTNTEAPPSRARDMSVEYAYLSNHLEVRRRLQPLTDEPSVRGRVRLNLASIALSFDQREEARTHLEAIARGTSNACLVFLSHLLRGRLAFEEKLLDQAEVSFRRALALFPGAQSASIALAATLSQAGRSEEALETVEHAYTQGPIADDPWTAWQNAGHCTEWFEYQPRLRGAWR